MPLLTADQLSALDGNASSAGAPTSGLLNSDELLALTKPKSAPLMQSIGAGLLTGFGKAIQDVPFSKYLVPASKYSSQLASLITSQLPQSVTQSPAYQRTALAAEYGPTVAQLVRPTYEIGKLGIKGLKGAYDVLNKVVGKKAENTATNFMNNLMGDATFSNAHVPIANDIRNLYSGAKKEIGDEYENIKKEAINRGYANDVSGYFPGISLQSSPIKSINTPLFNNVVKNIQPTTTELQDTLSGFLKNKSFNNAHELQSVLGKEASALKSSEDGSDRLIGGQLDNARVALRNDMTNSLVNSGDSDLAQRYHDATDMYKNTVAPFLENSLTRKIVLNKGLKEVNPSNLINALKSQDAAPMAIKNMLSDNSKNIILGSALRAASKSRRGAMSIDPAKLIKRFDTLDNRGFGEFITPASEDAMDIIDAQLSKSKNIKRVLGVGAGATGLEALRRYLGVEL